MPTTAAAGATRRASSAIRSAEDAGCAAELRLGVVGEGTGEGTSSTGVGDGVGAAGQRLSPPTVLIGERLRAFWVTQ